MTSTARQAFRRAVLEGGPRLVEAMFLCQVSTASEALSGLPHQPTCVVMASHVDLLQECNAEDGAIEIGLSWQGALGKVLYGGSLLKAYVFSKAVVVLRSPAYEIARQTQLHSTSSMGALSAAACASIHKQWL